MPRVPHKQIVTRPDGTKIMVRFAYNPAEYSVPQSELERLRTIPGGYGSEDILAEHDGELSSYQQIRRFERDGKRWILLLSPAEYAIEVELTRSKMGEVRPVPPEEAWRLCREQDKGETRFPVEVERGSALP
jgi:hypothetical protein